MKLRFVMLFLLLSHFIFADCAGYTDKFEVRVLDGKLRAVEGAEVTVTFDRGQLFGEQYFTTEPKYTNSTGRIQYSIYNQGKAAREIDCTIWVNASIGGSRNVTTVEANSHGPTVDAVLSDLYLVDFYVRDQFYAPLENASVSFGDATGKTDSSGLLKFYYKKGEYDYFANFANAKRSGKISLQDDIEFTVFFPFYDITIDVKDDYGKPLNATVTILGEEFAAENGHFAYDDAFGDLIPYEVEYNQIKKTGEIEPEKSRNAVVVYDIHAPIFGKVEAETMNNLTSLTIPVTEAGSYASGLDVPSFKVTYRVEPADVTTPWSSAVVYSTGFNTFSAEFPPLPKNSIVSFRAEIKDKGDNKATLDGKFSVIEQVINDTQNQSDTHENGQETQEIPLFYILGGVILAIIAIYLVIRLKSKE